MLGFWCSDLWISVEVQLFGCFRVSLMRIKRAHSVPGRWGNLTESREILYCHTFLSDILLCPRDSGRNTSRYRQWSFNIYANLGSSVRCTCHTAPQKILCATGHPGWKASSPRCHRWTRRMSQQRHTKANIRHALWSGTELRASHYIPDCEPPRAWHQNGIYCTAYGWRLCTIVSRRLLRTW